MLIVDSGKHKYTGCDDNLRRSLRVVSKPVEFSAHEFAAPIIPVKKDESQNEEDDDETIIIDNDIPFRYCFLNSLFNLPFS